MLDIRNLHKQFGDLVAVSEFNLAVEAGEIVVLMGPSGCGKSTAIRTINRLVEPDHGSIVLNNANILAMKADELREARKRIGFVFQHFNLIRRLNALENVMLGLVMSGMNRETARDKAADSLTKVGLGDYLNHIPEQMSGGQQQRVGIARALAYEPELMLWDEPTASLDPILVREVLVVMEELAHYRSSTMIVVTHELPFALRVADRIVLMDKGSIVEEGKPSQVFVNPRSDIGQKYKELIEYQMNTSAQSLSGQVQGNQDTGA